MEMEFQSTNINLRLQMRKLSSKHATGEDIQSKNKIKILL